MWICKKKTKQKTTLIISCCHTIQYMYISVQYIVLPEGYFLSFLYLYIHLHIDILGLKTYLNVIYILII